MLLIFVRIFVFDFLHRNIATNKFLFRCKLAESSLCDFCNMEIDSIEYIFWTCQQTQSFRNKLFKWFVEIGIHVNRDNILLSFFHSRNKIFSYVDYSLICRIAYVKL
jgi:hypothetical protein